MQCLMETSAGNITIELYDKEAPDTVANFVKLVNMQFYDGSRY
jgi:cyclophilin family peptidyl-prolyl cis-trans isomerase